MTEIQRKVILAMRDGDFSKSKAARIMKKARNVICYHLENIQNETGLDPKKFNDFTKLLDMATAGQEMVDEYHSCSRCGITLQHGLTNRIKIVIMGDDAGQSTDCVDVNLCLSCSAKLISFARGAYEKD